MLGDNWYKKKHGKHCFCNKIVSVSQSLERW